MKPINSTGDPTPHGEDAMDEVRALLAAPPGWLVEQLDRCREDPDRMLNPTASAISAQLSGSPARWREVEPILEAHLSEARAAPRS